MRTRSWRRFQAVKTKAKAKHVGTINCWKNAIKHADNLSICSCWMCGNPRKHFKVRTRQELTAEMDEKQQMEDFFDSTSSRDDER